VSKTEFEIDTLRAELTAMKDITATLIAWIAQSANSPISIDDARELLRRIDEDGAK
jgi:hypothetical protein